MSYKGDGDSRSYEGLGSVGYQEPFPGGKPPSPSQLAGQRSGQSSEPFRLNITPEERQLAQQISRQYIFSTFMPLGLGSVLGLRLLVKRGIIKQRLSVNLGATFVAYVYSKLLTVKETQRQLLEKFPDGVFAQTRNMSRDQIMEYMRQRNSTESQEVQRQTVQPKFDPDSRNTNTAGLDDRFKPNVDGFDVTKKREDSHDMEPLANRKTYAELRQQAHRDLPVSRPPPGGLSTMNRPDVTPNEPSTLSDDPPSKLKLRKNKYGDEME